MSPGSWKCGVEGPGEVVVGRLGALGGRRDGGMAGGCCPCVGSAVVVYVGGGLGSFVDGFGGGWFGWG
eukprot:scaffold150154_cov40-Cyclotella_meneghiniana.AAC.1